MFLGILEWVVIGLVVGFVASKVVNLRGDDARFGIGVTLGAALVVAAVYSWQSGSGVSAWNPWGLLFAVIGAAVGAVVWHAVRSRFISHEVYRPRSSY